MKDRKTKVGSGMLKTKPMIKDNTLTSIPTLNPSLTTMVLQFGT